MLPSDGLPSEPNFRVKLLPLTERSVGEMGTIIRDIDEADIELVKWRPSGTRPVTSGGYGHVAEGPFEIFWRGETMYSRNLAVDREDLLGWRVDPNEAQEDQEPQDRSLLLVDEVNYHDDGGQAFIARGVPTVFLVAPPGDEPSPDDFVALYSDGTAGLNMRPGVWHTAPLPLADRAVYDNKQGSIHATMGLWARKEWGALFEVPLLVPPLAPGVGESG